MPLGIETESDVLWPCDEVRTCPFTCHRQQRQNALRWHCACPWTNADCNRIKGFEYTRWTANICNLQWIETKAYNDAFLSSVKYQINCSKSNSLANLYVILTYANKLKNGFPSSMRINLCMWRHLVSFGYDFTITAIRGTVFFSSIYCISHISACHFVYVFFSASLLLCLSWCALHIGLRS